MKAISSTFHQVLCFSMLYIWNLVNAFAALMNPNINSSSTYLRHQIEYFQWLFIIFILLGVPLLVLVYSIFMKAKGLGSPNLELIASISPPLSWAASLLFGLTFYYLNSLFFNTETN